MCNFAYQIRPGVSNSRQRPKGRMEGSKRLFCEKVARTELYKCAFSNLRNKQLVALIASICKVDYIQSSGCRAKYI